MPDEKKSKAFTATLNRVAKKFGVSAEAGGVLRVSNPPMTLHVATTATLAEVVEYLLTLPGDACVVMTNREAIREALRVVGETRLGVMNPHGEVVKPPGTTLPPQKPPSRGRRKGG